MIKKALLASAMWISILALCGPAMAHHSANAQFDVSKEFEITGVLTKVENINPHSWWYLDVKDADGKVSNWKLESLAPSGLIRQGLRLKDDVKIGETVTATISPAWKEPTVMTVLSWTPISREIMTWRAMTI